MRTTVFYVLTIGVLFFPTGFSRADERSFPGEVDAGVVALRNAQYGGDEAFDRAAARLVTLCRESEQARQRVKVHGFALLSMCRKKVGPTREQTRSVSAVRLLGYLGSQTAPVRGILSQLAEQQPMPHGDRGLAGAQQRILENAKNEAARLALAEIDATWAPIRRTAATPPAGSYRHGQPEENSRGARETRTRTGAPEH